jgi:hypothetical protein
MALLSASAIEAEELGQSVGLDVLGVSIVGLYWFTVTFDTLLKIAHHFHCWWRATGPRVTAGKLWLSALLRFFAPFRCIVGVVDLVGH